MKTLFFKLLLSRIMDLRMPYRYIQYLGLFLIPVTSFCQLEFITTWKTDNPGMSNATSITIPTFTGAVYNYSVDWNNDGIYEESGITGDVTHDFGTPGIYTIRINGAFPRIYFNWSGDCNKITNIDQWGNNAWTSMERAFYGCGNLNSTATDTPNLTGCIDLSYMFSNAVNFNGQVNNWNVTSIWYMNSMFASATSFNQDLNSWNTSNVRNMNRMFYYATAFNKSLNSWDVSNVMNMSEMFNGALSFNQNLNSWNTGNVTTMFGMFANTANFNGNISSWNVSKVLNMGSMFENSTFFNQNIGNWNVGLVWNMWAMFKGALSFNQNIGTWNVGNVQDMYEMFMGASAFNQDIGSWNVSNARLMGYMFANAQSFNQNIGAWIVSSVTNMGDMFYNASSFNQDISAWIVSSVTNMYGMFYNATGFNQNIGSWTLNGIVNLGAMLDNTGISCENYDNILIGWNSNPLTPNSRSLGAAGRNYWQAQSARNNLITVKNWTITGDSYFNCNYPVPLNILSFTAVCINPESVILKWSISGSNDLNDFEIQRSFDGVEWNLIGKLGDLKLDGSIRCLEFIDSMPEIGNNYYRLKISGQDGYFIYSDIRVIRITKADKVEIFPNPADEKLNIAGIHYVQYSITDFSGRTVLKGFYEGQPLEISQMMPGIYFVKIYHKNGTYIRKLAKI